MQALLWLQALSLLLHGPLNLNVDPAVRPVLASQRPQLPPKNEACHYGGHEQPPEHAQHYEDDAGHAGRPRELEEVASLRVAVVA